MRVLVIRVTEQGDLYKAECGKPTSEYVSVTDISPTRAIKALAIEMDAVEDKCARVDTMLRYGSIIDM